MLVDLASELWPTASDSPSFAEEFSLPGFSEETDVLEGLSTRVILFNDNVHTFDEVIMQVSKATGCSKREAASVAWDVHTRGQALVFEGDIMDCLHVSSVLEEIALHTQVLT